MTAAHLNTSIKRDGSISLINDGDVSDLFGCVLDAKNPVYKDEGSKFCKSIVPELIYPSIHFECGDPYFAEGYINYAKTRLTTGVASARLSNRFRDEDIEAMPISLVENKCGKGYAILMTNLKGKGPHFMSETQQIIEKWYQKLEFPKKYDAEFYESLQCMKIPDTITIEQYDIGSTDGKRNLLSALFMCEELSEKYAKKGIGEEILVHTLSDLVTWTNTWSELKGKLYLGEMCWLKRLLGMRLFRLGRLQFGMQIAPRDIPYKGVKKGEPEIGIHIPRGEPLERGACIQSIEDAKIFFREYYPEFEYKCFHCFSWLLDDSLEQFLNPDANILQFGRMFEEVYRIELDEMLRYLF